MTGPPPAIDMRGVGVWRVQPGGARAVLLHAIDWLVRKVRTVINGTNLLDDQSTTLEMTLN